MSRQEFTDEEKVVLAKKKYIVLEGVRKKEFATRIATHDNVEFQITKNDRGFYLKTLPIVEDITDEFFDEEQVRKTFSTFNDLVRYLV